MKGNQIRNAIVWKKRIKDKETERYCRGIVGSRCLLLREIISNNCERGTYLIMIGNEVDSGEVTSKRRKSDKVKAERDKRYEEVLCRGAEARARTKEKSVSKV